MKNFFLAIFSFITALFSGSQRNASLPIKLPATEGKALSAFEMLVTFDQEKIIISEEDIVVDQGVNLDLIAVEENKIKLLGIVKELKAGQSTEIATLNFTVMKKGKASFTIKSLQVFCQPENCSATSEKKTGEETVSI